MKFSVIIPAYNESKFVGKSIKAVLDQDYPRNEFEVIVVDNNSTDDTAEIAKKAGADRVIKEIKKGTNIARQRGIDEGKGEIFAFLDADCEPPQNWLRKIEENLLKTGVASVSGPYDLGFSGLKKLGANLFFVIAPIYLKFVSFFSGKANGIILGGNFAVWRWAIEKIGSFPPLEFWGDDTAIALMLSRKAGKVIFDQNLIIKSSPRRFQKTGFFKLTMKYISHHLKTYTKY